MTPGVRVGVVGIGGLGHLAVQFAKALGALEVVAISSSLRKKDDALKLGASQVLNSTDPADVANHKGTLDVIICTVSSNDVIWENYLSLLKSHGTFIVVGLPEEAIKLSLGAVIGRQLKIAGSIIGSPRDIEDMLEVAGIHGVRPWIEKAPMSQVNESLDKVRANNVRFRYVLEN